MPEDITQTGPVGLEGLRGINQGGQPSYSGGDEDLLDVRPFQTGFVTPKQAHQEILGKMGEFSPISSGADIGSSTWDENFYDPDTIRKAGDIRAENQPGALQLLNGVVKMGTTAVTTFLDGTLGTIIGLGQGIANIFDDDENTSFISGFWDNDFNKWVASTQEKIEEIFPNYYTQQELESPWYKNIWTANFWGDKFMKNMGFTIGALVTTAVPGFNASWLGEGVSAAARAFKFGDKALKIADKAGRAVTRVGNTLLAASSEGAIEAINAVNDGLNLELANLERQKSAAVKEAQDWYEQHRFNLNTEGGSPYETYLNRLAEIDQQYDSAVAKIKAGRTNIGNSTYLLNLAILSISNNLEFARYLKGGYDRQLTFLGMDMMVNGEKAASIKAWGRALAKGTGSLAIPEDIGKNIGGKVAAKTFGRMVSEGSEEGLQRLTSDTEQIQEMARVNQWAKQTNNSFYAKGINPDISDEFVNSFKALHQAWTQSFGSLSASGWEEVFLGGLTGGIGTVGVIRDPHTGKVSIGWQGGVKEAWKEEKEKAATMQERLESFNKRVATPEFRDKARHAFTAMALTEEMDRFLYLENILGFKNAELAQAVNDALYFQNSGALEAYKSFYEDMSKNISDDDIAQVKEQLKSLNGKVSPYDKMTDKEIREVLKDKAKSTLKKIESTIDIHNSHNIQHRRKMIASAREVIREGSEYSPEEWAEIGLRELTSEAALVNDLIRRRDEVQRELDSMNKTDKLIRGTRSYEQAIKDLDEAITEHQKIYEDHKKNDFKDLLTKLQRYNDLAQMRKRSTNAEALKSNLQTATTLQEVGDIYFSSPVEDRQAVFDEAIEGADEAQKALLEQFKPFLASFNALEGVTNEVAASVFPLGEAMSKEELGKTLAARVLFANNLNSFIEDALGEYQTNPEVAYTKETISQVIRNAANELRKVVSTDPKDADTNKVYADALEKVADNLEKAEVAYKAAEPRKKKESAKKAEKKEEESAPKEKKEKKEKKAADWYEGEEDEDEDEDEEEVVIEEEEEVEDEEIPEEKEEKEKKSKEKKLSKPKKEKKEPASKRDESNGDAVEVIIFDAADVTLTGEVEHKDGMTYIAMGDNRVLQVNKSLNDDDVNVVKETYERVKEQDIAGIRSAIEKAINDLIEAEKNAGEGTPESAMLPESSSDMEEEEDRTSEKEEAGVSMRGNAFRPFRIGSSKNPGLAQHIGVLLDNEHIKNWYSLPFAKGIDYIINGGHLAKLMDKVGVEGKLKVQYAGYYENGIRATGVGKEGLPHILLVIPYTEEVKAILPENNENIKGNITDGGRYLVVGSLGFRTGEKALKAGHNAINDAISKQREALDEKGEFTVLREGKNGEWTNYIYEVSPGTAIYQDNVDDTGDMSLGLVLNARNITGEKVTDLKFSVVMGHPESKLGIYLKHFGKGVEQMQRYPLGAAMFPGRVFVWMPTATGKYMPVVVTPLTFGELTEANGQVYKDIMGAIRQIAKLPLDDVKGRAGAFGYLRDLLVFSTSEHPGNQIFFGSEKTDKEGNENPNFNVISYQKDGIYQDNDSINLNVTEMTEDEVFEKLVRIIKDLNPRVAVNAATLGRPDGAGIAYYVNSGVIQTNVRQWGTANARSYVYPVLKDGHAELDFTPKKEKKSVRDARNKGMSFYLNKSRYKYMSDGVFVDKDDELITDKELLDYLRDVLSFETTNVEPTVVGNSKYFFAGDKVYHWSKGAGYTLLDDETKKKVLKKLQDIQNKEKQEEAARKAQEEGIYTREDLLRELDAAEKALERAKKRPLKDNEKYPQTLQDFILNALLNAELNGLVGGSINFADAAKETGLRKELESLAKKSGKKQILTKKGGISLQKFAEDLKASAEVGTALDTATLDEIRDSLIDLLKGYTRSDMRAALMESMKENREDVVAAQQAVDYLNEALAQLDKEGFIPEEASKEGEEEPEENPEEKEYTPEEEEDLPPGGPVGGAKVQGRSSLSTWDNSQNSINLEDEIISIWDTDKQLKINFKDPFEAVAMAERDYPERVKNLHTKEDIESLLDDLRNCYMPF